MYPHISFKYPERRRRTSLEMLSFFRERTVGMYRNSSNEQSRIISHFNKNSKFIQERKYEFNTAPYYDPASMMIAVDVGERNVLIGGSSNHESVVQSAILGTKNDKFDQILMIGHDLRGLQFTPNGNEQFMVNLFKGLKIFDTSRHELVINISHAGEYFSSDWNPWDANLIAFIGGGGLELADLRENPNSSVLKEPIRAGRACYWSTRNSNHVMCSNFGNTVWQYDTRNKSSIAVGGFSMGGSIERIRMNPNGTFLFTWSMEEHNVHMCYCNLYETWDNATYINAFSADEWELNSYYYHDIFQFHVTDTHLFMPMKSETWLPDEESDVVVEVIDYWHSNVSNKIKAISNGFDPIQGRHDYPRIDAVTAPANQWDNERIYTLNDRREVGIYTLSSGNQEDVRVRTKELSKASEQIIDA